MVTPSYTADLYYRRLLNEPQQEHPHMLVPVEREKNSTERGRRFRERRKQHVHMLEQMIGTLQREVLTLLHIRQSLWEEKPLISRHNLSDSLVHLVQEYYCVFHDGLPVDEDPASTTYKLQFLRQIMDPAVNVNGEVGLDLLIAQWRLNNACQAHFWIQIGPVEPMGGTIDHPIVAIDTTRYARFTRELFQHIFPHVLQNEALIQKILNHEVTYHSMSRFEFTNEDKISVIISEVDLIDAFYALVRNVDELAELFGGSNFNVPMFKLVETSMRHSEPRSWDVGENPSISKPIKKMEIEFMLTDPTKTREDEEDACH